MSEYDFSEQAALLEDAKYILEDYGIEGWSFGGGTALSCYYYNHRMSYDIDIFTEDRSSVQKLIDYKETICEGFGISVEDTEVSNSGITFILSDIEHQLKLDFVESSYLTSEPFVTDEVLGLKNIKIQTPLEIIAKKVKHRKNITIRDYVDFAFVEKEHNIIYLKKLGITYINMRSENFLKEITKSLENNIVTIYIGTMIKNYL